MEQHSLLSSQWLILALVLAYHITIINPLEKRLFQKMYPSSTWILRPSQKCRKTTVVHHSCLGMPSGTTEIMTIVAILLYRYQQISLPWVFFIVLVTALQRILVQKHTFLQVAVGILFGYLHSSLYLYMDLSFLCIPFLIALSIVLFLSNQRQQIRMKQFTDDLIR